jgi:hypothetical protein
MADASYALAAIEEDVRKKGQCLVDFATVEHSLDTSADDDNQDFIDDLDAWLANTSWVTSYEIDWLFRRVLFRGPITL